MDTSETCRSRIFYETGGLGDVSMLLFMQYLFSSGNTVFSGYRTIDVAHPRVSLYAKKQFKEDRDADDLKGIVFE